MRPMGSPAFVKPHGTLQAGSPVRFATHVSRAATSSTDTRRPRMSVSSCPIGVAVSGADGDTSTSTFANTVRSDWRMRARTRCPWR